MEPATAHDLGTAASKLVVELVGIDSVNPGLVPDAAGERGIVEHLRTRLVAAGLETQVVVPDGHPARPSLLAIGPRPVDARRTVVLTGHLDTVGVEGMHAPFTPRIDGERLHGRGACDMKGGIAGIVVAAEYLSATCPSVQVVLALVADEEDLSMGTESVLSALPGLGVAPDAALVAEPTWLARTGSLRGYALVEVTFTGRASHSSQPAHGVNAVAHLGRLLHAVESLDARIAPSGGSVMVTVAGGGESPFVLARSARAVVERRCVPGEPATTALDEVQAVLDAMREVDPTVDARAELVVAREPWRLEDSGPAVDLADALDDALDHALARSSAPGRPTQPFHAPYWMEAPLWQSGGIPALVCGPAGGGLHAADEWVDLAQVRAFTAALVAAVQRWGSADAD